MASGEHRSFEHPLLVVKHVLNLFFNCYAYSITAVEVLLLFTIENCFTAYKKPVPIVLVILLVSASVWNSIFAQSFHFVFDLSTLPANVSIPSHQLCTNPSAFFIDFSCGSLESYFFSRSPNCECPAWTNNGCLIIIEIERVIHI